MTNVFVILNGQPMTEKEYKTYKKAKYPKATTTKKRNNVMTERQFAAYEVKELMKKFGVLNSLIAYNRNGYRQWGNEHTAIMNIKEISKPFNNTLCNAKKLINIANEIERLAKRNSKEIPSLLTELTWQLTDTTKALNKLIHGVKQSSILYGLSDNKCISENGRRLGLKILIAKSEKSLISIRYSIEQLKQLSNEL